MEVRDFRPDFWAVSNLEAIWSIFCLFLVRGFGLGLEVFFASNTRPEDQPSKRLRERNGLNRLRFELSRSIS